MLSERLKIETHKSHIDVEKLIIPRIKKLDAKRSYTSLLKIFYGYFKPIEDKLDAIVDNELLPDYAERRKASAILEDIEFVNRETCETVCKDLPEIETSEQALGALYVMEGSTLGGTILTKLVTEKMQFDSCDGVRFFSGYGEQTMDKWQIFKEHLNNYSSEKQVHDQVVNAANETFIKFRNWIETHQQ